MQKNLYLLDNTFLSDYESEKKARTAGPAVEFARRHATRQFKVSVVTVAEFYERFGRAATVGAIAGYTVIGVHLADALKCGEIQTRLSKKRLGENDAWLAAQAMRAGATLVTRDKRFKDVRGLSVETY